MGRLFDINIDDPDVILAIRNSIIQGTFTEGNGITITSWSSEGTTVTKEWPISAARLLEETLIFLKEYDPALYGRRVTRTVPGYIY